MYEHRTLSLNQVLSVAKHIQVNFDEVKKNPKVFDRSLKSYNDYIQIYGTKYGKTEIYGNMIASYVDLSNQILDTEKDTILLNVALKASRQADKINALFGESVVDPVLEARLLIALGKKDEAKDFLQSAIQHTKDPEIRKTAKEELDKLM